MKKLIYIYIYLNSDGNIKPIYENIKIEDLMDEPYNNSIIFYDKDISYDRTIKCYDK